MRLYARPEELEKENPPAYQIDPELVPVVEEILKLGPIE
jgi:hypothetical protein